MYTADNNNTFVVVDVTYNVIFDQRVANMSILRPKYSLIQLTSRVSAEPYFITQYLSQRLRLEIQSSTIYLYVSLQTDHIDIVAAAVMCYACPFLTKKHHANWILTAVVVDQKARTSTGILWQPLHNEIQYYLLITRYIFGKWRFIYLGINNIRKMIDSTATIQLDIETACSCKFFSQDAIKNS